jgi:hypothetical protein
LGVFVVDPGGERVCWFCCDWGAEKIKENQGNPGKSRKSMKSMKIKENQGYQ